MQPLGNPIIVYLMRYVHFGQWPLVVRRLKRNFRWTNSNKYEKCNSVSSDPWPYWAIRF
jgi:hypothetical protein